MLSDVSVRLLANFDVDVSDAEIGESESHPLFLACMDDESYLINGGQVACLIISISTVPASRCCRFVTQERDVIALKLGMLTDWGNGFPEGLS